MEVLNKPVLSRLALGDTYKVTLIEGGAGMKMPPHYSTLEVVIVVQKGEGLLQMADGDKYLKQGDCFIVPAKKEHTLTIKKSFKALAVMAVESKINFI